MEAEYIYGNGGRCYEVHHQYHHQHLHLVHTDRSYIKSQYHLNHLLEHAQFTNYTPFQQHFISPKYILHRNLLLRTLSSCQVHHIPPELRLPQFSQHAESTQRPHLFHSCARTYRSAQPRGPSPRALRNRRRPSRLDASGQANRPRCFTVSSPSSDPDEKQSIDAMNVR